MLLQHFHLCDKNNIHVEYIVLTHGHGDHIGGVKELKEKLNVPVVIHKEDAEMLEDASLNLSNYNLTDRQKEIIDFIRSGLTNKEIATKLFISENTVKYHLKIIYEILDEVMDYGCPQFTDPALLKNYIQEGGFNDALLKDLSKLKQLTSQATGVTSWRP